MTHLSLIYYFILGIAGTALLSQAPALFSYLFLLHTTKYQDSPPLPPVKTETERIFEERRQKLHESYSDTSVNYNENIDPIIYDREKFNVIMQDEHNAQELQWTRRIMMECTSRGNLIMVYNLYKQSFDYYADNYIPHQLLTSAAMKYVILYRCRDFFIDSNYTDKPSNIMVAIKAFDDAKNKKTDENSGKPMLRKGPFVKNKVSATTAEPKTSAAAAAEQKPPEKHINKFSYMGKLANFSMLRKPKPVHATNGFKTELLDFGNLSYEEYKNLKNAQK